MSALGLLAARARTVRTARAPLRAPRLCTHRFTPPPARGKLKEAIKGAADVVTQQVYLCTTGKQSLREFATLCGMKKDAFRRLLGAAGGKARTSGGVV